MTILRVYDPDECDGQGVPLDWWRCRTCNGTGVPLMSSKRLKDCSTCDGHGSLKAAALAAKLRTVTECCGAARGHYDILTEGSTGPCCEKCRRYAPKMVTQIARCEDCGHPMSEGTKGALGRAVLTVAREALAEGREPWGEALRAGTPHPVHFSPCDEGCRHGGPVRQIRLSDGSQAPLGPLDGRTTAGAVVASLGDIHRTEASWRPVDVRMLGWPHDLRPEKLMILCLRCWAGRKQETEGEAA